MAHLDPLLLRMMQNHASDLHIVVGQRPKFRVHGEVTPVDDYPEQRDRYLAGKDFDFAYGIGEQARYRVNYFFQRTGYGSVFRIIPYEIATIEQLNLPPVL